MPRDLNSQQVGTQNRAPATEPKTRVLTGMTKFPMSYRMPNTARYGHITPFYYQHSRGDDTVPLFSEHRLRTYTMKSPVDMELNMNKSYFMVDMKAIYPRNWDLMFVSPSKGDDVPADTRFVSKNFLLKLSDRLNKFKIAFNSSNEQPVNVITDFIEYILLLESMFSNGSLLAEFNIHLNQFIVCNEPSPDVDTGESKKISFDDWLDKYFFNNIKSLTFTINRKNYKGWSREGIYLKTDGTTLLPYRSLFDMLRNNSFSVVDNAEMLGFSTYLANAGISTINFDWNNYSNGSVVIPDDYPINFEVIAAYQLGCAQFFTDSHIDYVYNASLYRDAVEYVISRFNGDRIKQFSYNGVKRLYDAFSGHNLDLLVGGLSWIGLGEYNSYYSYFKLLFGHRNSLRYGDYFVTGRPNPLGIGDVSVDTSQASVSVIDITKKIQYQRFLNAVNLAYQSVASYARDVLGLDDAGDISYEIPAFLGHKTLSIRGMEVENTGSNQFDANSVTTLLKSANNTHAFELKTKRPCIIIGVYSFDAQRVYSKTIDRMHMHQNRFDDFIPQMQYIGDQQIWLRELDAKNPSTGVFAYSLRYMEYKLRTNYAAGGAIDKLPSWFFITDNNDGNPLQNNITPDYIRSSPAEFDRFYSSLTGYSLGNYFHFVVNTINHQELTRKMDYAPEPLN